MGRSNREGAGEPSEPRASGTRRGGRRYYQRRQGGGRAGEATAKEPFATAADDATTFRVWQQSLLATATTGTTTFNEVWQHGRVGMSLPATEGPTRQAVRTTCQKVQDLSGQWVAGLVREPSRRPSPPAHAQPPLAREGSLQWQCAARRAPSENGRGESGQGSTLERCGPHY